MKQPSLKEKLDEFLTQLYFIWIDDKGTPEDMAYIKAVFVDTGVFQRMLEIEGEEETLCEACGKPLGDLSCPVCKKLHEDCEKGFQRALKELPYREIARKKAENKEIPPDPSLN